MLFKILCIDFYFDVCTNKSIPRAKILQRDFFLLIDTTIGKCFKILFSFCALGAAWWSMASHLAAQDYLARLQASGLNFTGLSNPADPYSSLGIPSLMGHHKSSKNSSSKSLPKSTQNCSSSKEKNSSQFGKSGESPIKTSGSPMHNNKIPSPNSTITTSTPTTLNTTKYSTSAGLTIQPSMKLPSTGGSSSTNSDKKIKANDMTYLKTVDKKTASTKVSQSDSSIFTSPLSLASNTEKAAISTCTTTATTTTNSVPNLPTSILR